MSESLSEVIRSAIAAGGPIPFRDFMELALYHPALGYYASGRARVGRKGDFFTNVSVGSLFGRLLARQFAGMWRAMGSPAAFAILEQGAHEGEFAADVLGALRDLEPVCFEAASYRIIEPLPVLASRQRERLAPFAAKTAWVASIEELAGAVGVHFSNELLDAFPVHLVVWTGREWRERHVADRAGTFVFTDGPLTSAALEVACGEMPLFLPAGYVTEVNLAARRWIGDVGMCLRRGFVLAVDYGWNREEYYAPGRIAGTLSARASHRPQRDPLARPGEHDLTAHVEFSSVIEAAGAAGLRLAGFTDQHHFMVGLGALHFADGANAADRRAFQTLMHPEMMGCAFKVLCLAKGIGPLPELEGFRYARA
jgi:SAM-dependent MidA family methyltransferase